MRRRTDNIQEEREIPEMLKRILLGTLLIGLIGVLVAGAIIRTVDRTENVAEARGQGRGPGSGEETGYATGELGEGYGVYAQGNGRGGYGPGAGTVERKYLNHGSAPEEWDLYEGTVVRAPAAGVDLVIETDSGEEVEVGTGPGYMEGQGFTLEAGERVQLQGYWEDGEFKAAQVTRLRRLGGSETIALRDEIGRPAWAGAGRGAQAEARGGRGGQGRAGAPSDGTGTGQAEVGEWVTIHGDVVSVDGNTMIVQSADGQEMAVENRAWWFAQEQGFAAEVGDQVTLLGFYEDGRSLASSESHFEAGQISNETTGKTVQIRESSGRPLWAGRGRRGG
jgi:hypothetical protein